MTAKERTGEADSLSATLPAGPDVVSARDEQRRLAGMLRAGVGFRVDGPDGRVGVVSAVVPDYGGGPPERIEIATGLFLVRSVNVPFGQVTGVDPFSRRVAIGAVPEGRSQTRQQVAGAVRRFRRAGGR